MYNNSSSTWNTLVAAAAVTATGFCLTANQTARMEPASQSASAVTKDDNDNDGDEDDPYANLPEEDEPTDCSMCNTFRQGPCRPHWRKLERCFKDHEKEKNGGQKCIRYFMPHQQCLMQYTNLYNLIRMTSLQDYVEETETTLPSSQRTKMAIPEIDWSVWDEFQKDAGDRFTQGLDSVDIKKNKKTPLWKRFPENTEPVVLSLSTQIPREDDEKRLMLRFAYVLDQDGMVLGVESNPMYRQLKEQVQGSAKAKEEENAAAKANDEEEEENAGPNLTLEFYIVPSITKRIQVKAMYAKKPSTETKDEEAAKSDVLKESPRVKLGGSS